MTETSAADDRNAVVELLTGLYDRGLTEHLNWSSAVDVTRIALAAIDRYAQAAATPDGPVEETSPPADRPYELAVERYLVDRLTALLRDPQRLSEQEIRAEALSAAARVMATAASPDGRRTLKLARQFEDCIRDGSLPEPPPPIAVA